MKKIIWDENYSVGVQELDEQHKKIIQFINDLIDNPTMGVRSEELHKILQQMFDYMKDHLLYEEKLLKEKNYPDLEAHVEIHELFVDRISELSDDALSIDNTVPVQLLSFLRNWWEHHVLEEDMKYKSFFDTC